MVWWGGVTLIHKQWKCINIVRFLRTAYVWYNGYSCAWLGRFLILFQLHITDDLIFFVVLISLDLDVVGRIILKWILSVYGMGWYWIYLAEFFFDKRIAIQSINSPPFVLRWSSFSCYLDLILRHMNSHTQLVDIIRNSTDVLQWVILTGLRSVLQIHTQ